MDFEKQVKDIIAKQGIEECTTTTIIDEIKLFNNNKSLSDGEQEFIREIIDDCLIKKMVEEEDLRMARELQTSMNPKRETARKIKKNRKIEKETKKRIPSPNNPFNRPMILSSSLAKLVNIDLDLTEKVTELSRPQVVKSIWSYVKKRDLQDSANKKILICDSVMKEIFKKDRIDCFEMNKVLSLHLTKKEDIIIIKIAKEDNINVINIPIFLRKYLFASASRKTFSYEEIENAFIEKLKGMALIERPGYMVIDLALGECIKNSSKKIDIEEPIHLISLMNWLRIVLNL